MGSKFENRSVQHSKRTDLILSHLCFAHMALEKVIIDDNGGVANIEVAGYSAQLCDIQVAALLIKACHLALLKLTCCITHECLPAFTVNRKRFSHNLHVVTTVTQAICVLHHSPESSCNDNHPQRSESHLKYLNTTTQTSLHVASFKITCALHQTPRSSCNYSHSQQLVCRTTHKYLHAAYSSESSCMNRHTQQLDSL